MTMSHLPRRLASLLLPLVLVAALPLVLSGCGEAEAQMPEQVSAADLPCADYDPTLEEWESAGWFGDTCDWVEFTPSTSFEVEHPLGRIPKSVLIYISFTPNGASSTLASGDSGLIVGATAETVTVRNNTEQRFYLRVVAR
ncbi:MAG: hypothetical protein IPG81_14220 [Sandaracinaceae bacterium]|nr:hypothetical protein [Sandaracinaceae bacterium]